MKALILSAFFWGRRHHIAGRANIETRAISSKDIDTPTIFVFLLYTYFI